MNSWKILIIFDSFLYPQSLSQKYKYMTFYLRCFFAYHLISSFLSGNTQNIDLPHLFLLSFFFPIPHPPPFPSHPGVHYDTGGKYQGWGYWDCAKNRSVCVQKMFYYYSLRCLGRIRRLKFSFHIWFILKAKLFSNNQVNRNQKRRQVGKERKGSTRKMFKKKNYSNVCVT